MWERLMVVVGPLSLQEKKKQGLHRHSDKGDRAAGGQRDEGSGDTVLLKQDLGDHHMVPPLLHLLMDPERFVLQISKCLA